MSLWRARQALQLTLGASQWVLRAADGEIARGSWAPGSVGQLVRELDMLTVEGAPTKARIDAGLHDGWVRSFMVEPPAGTRSLAELRACAQARFETLFGLDGSQWRLCGAWHASQPFVVVAASAKVLGAIERLCARHRWRLRSLQPTWARTVAAQQWPKGDQWWGVTGEGATTVLRTQGGRITHVRTTTLHPEASPERAVARERLRAGELLPDSSAWRGLSADNPTVGKIDDLDFVADEGQWAMPTRRRLWPTAVSLFLALAVGGAVLQQWLVATREHGEAQSRLDALLQRARIVRKSAVPPSPLTPVQVEAINGAVHRLNTPWPAIFHGLEAATPAEVALLSIEPDARQTRVRGTALTRDEHAMLDYVSRLATTRPFVDARLLRHEASDQDQAQPVRFQFEAILGAARAQGSSRP